MHIHELRDVEAARTYCVQGLWLMRLAAPSADTVASVLATALEVLGAGEALPPLGFLADVSHLVSEPDDARRHERPVLPGWPDGLPRVYEDHVLGKLYVDGSFERAAAAVRRLHGRDRHRGLAYLVNQLRQRAGLGGVHFSPAIVKTLRTRPPEDVLAAGWDAWNQAGPSSLLRDQYEDLTTRVRNVAAVLGPEDVFELEHGIALAQFGQRLALRQVLQASASLVERMPRLRPRALPKRYEVPTRILDEDSYPVGGFTSISTRGTVESLLHSQLAYMERDDRPDLFDIKFLRDELLYYSRDENQFLRRRRTFVFALCADLEQARFKDADAPWQRIILALGLTLAAVTKLREWLGEDALAFEFLLLDAPNQPKAMLAEEAVLQMVLREQIANGSARIARLNAARFPTQCAQHARRSLCHCLTLSVSELAVELEKSCLAKLLVADKTPGLVVGGETVLVTASGDALTAWSAALERLLQEWQ